MTLDQKLKAHGERLAEKDAQYFKQGAYLIPKDLHYHNGFLSGHTAAAEVFRLAGRIEACSALTDYADELDADRIHIHAISKSQEKAEAQLAALLGDV